MTEPWYKQAYRRMLVDMHIPDWDTAFLVQYDPERMADLYEKAHVTSVMFYCQSHVGLCYWPTQTGQMHEGLHGRDVVGELLAALRKRHLAGCAYYSLIFNVWAFRGHPEWRMLPFSEPAARSFTAARMGVCCPNNPDYRAFARAQAEELARQYSFDGFFFDMTFWPTVCLCPYCRKAYRKASGKEIPRVVDWTSTDWCEFQAARERWLCEFAEFMTGVVKECTPGMPVYHNFAGALYDWQLSTPFSSAVHHDFLGADFYGGPTEQHVVSKLMMNLSPNLPAEFMTSRCVTLRDHVRMKPMDQMRVQALAATLFSSAFLFIDAIDVKGTVNPLVYERIGSIYKETAPYEPFLGGQHIEDIAIYFSDASKMDFAENGISLEHLPSATNTFPHARAVRGIARILQEMHLPFGIITEKQLGELGLYKLVILPNVLRMSQEEADAFRRYFQQGGRIYASRYTSLTETRGVRHADFMLADVFGAHFAADDLGEIAYLKPRSNQMEVALEPQDYLSLFPETSTHGRSSTVRLLERVEGDVLGTLTLPYASPKPGSVFDNNWASFHSSPPWQDLDTPVLVLNRSGRGQCVYCASDIEAEHSEANTRVMAVLIRSLLDQPLSFGAEAHHDVWMAGFHQPERNRITVGFLNYQAKAPIPVPSISFWLRPPDGRAFKRLVSLPEEVPVACTIEADGTLRAETKDLHLFRLLAAELAQR